MSLKQAALSGMFWTYLQQFGSQLISFVVQLVLARLLLPSDFGVIALFSVFLAIGNVLINSGLTNSLIRTKEIDDTDLSTVFFFNLFVSVIVYVMLFFTSPLIAGFFNMPILKDIIRVYALSLPVSAFSAIQQTIFTKNLDFKTQLKIQIPSLIISGITGIVLALTGFGVWSLVYMAIVQALISTVQFWLYSKWRPKRIFDKNKFKYHFNFGYKLALSGLLDTVFQNIYTLVIGKIYNPTQLGFYNRANTMQMLPVSSLSGPLNTVTFPLFARIQDDNEQLRNVYRRIMKMVIFIVAPVLTFIAVLGEPLFRFLLTEKWLPAVPYFQILCITGVLYPIHAYNLNILQVKGRSDLFLRLEIIKKFLTVLLIVISIRFGILGLIWGKVATSVIALFINCHYSGKFLNYGVWKQFGDLLPGVLLSVLVGTIMLFSDKYLLQGFTDIIRLISGVGLGTILYLGISYLLKLNELEYIKDILLHKK